MYFCKLDFKIMNDKIEVYQNLDINDMQGELWKTIDEHSLFSISNMGRIKYYRDFNGCYIIKQEIRNNYMYIRISNKKITNNYRVHRLVAIAFIKNPNNFLCVNHIDGNKKNNNFLNLEWCTHSQNIQHAYNIGLKLPTIGKKIQAINLITGEIFEFASAYEASRNIKGNQSNICTCCMGKRKSHKNYMFKYI